MSRRISILLILGWLITSSSVSLFTPQESSAVTASEWRAGNIINDTLFADGAGMSVAQIQNFLEKRLPYCDIRGTKPSELGGGTRAQYGASVGNPAPFTCITNYYEVPKTTPGAYIPENNYGRYNTDGSTYVPANSKSAAQLIYDAAQQYSVNPKALLIKLATESDGPLTSDEWPLKKQYYYAMGAHCPDSGPGGAANCDIDYSGFSMQIGEAAKLLRGYLDGMTQSWWPYKKPFQNNTILWNVVERGCGSSNVYIESKATAALYTYTPYQPNQAALNNMYGTGDNCSAYGNRNFWKVWNDWFGSTQDPGYTPFFQFPGSVATYILGSNNTYYHISDYARLKDYGFESVFKNRVKIIEKISVSAYTDKGELPSIARFEGPGVFAVDNGNLRPFPSESIFFNYGYSFGQEATLPKEMSDSMPQGQPMWQVAAASDGNSTYFINAGKKQAMCNYDVFTKLGSPAYSTQPMTQLRMSYLSTIPDGAPIAMDGDIIESWGSVEYGIWQNNLYTEMDANVARGSGQINCGAPSSNVKLLPKSGLKIGSFVKSQSNGTSYLISNKNKIPMATSGLDLNQASPITDTLLSKLNNETYTGVVRESSNPGVYLISNGKRYAIPSEDDLYGLNFDFTLVKSLSTSAFNVFPDGGVVYKPAKLVREDGTNGVYLLDENFVKHAFTNEDDFYNYGYTWPQVNVIKKGSLGSYTEDTPMKPYIKENASLYWLMDRGIKRQIPLNLVQNTAYNISSSNSTTLPVSILKNYPYSTPLTSVFRAGNTPAVYMIDAGQKRAFTSEVAFFKAGYKWSDVVSLKPSFVSSLPTGEYIY